MTLRARRLLYLTAIIIFLVSAPPLVLYTAGWRYDFTYNRLVATGSLVVKSRPERAQVLLNGRRRPEKTPAIINNILPGKINLEISKDGYFPWQRTLTVAARVTTLADNIKLFAQSAPQELLPTSLKQYWWNQKHDKIAYLTLDNELHLYNFLNKKDVFLMALPPKPTPAVSWSPHDDQLLVNRQIIEANFPEKIIDLDEITGKKFTNLQWDKTVPETLYGLWDGALYRLPYRLAAARFVTSGPLRRYYADKGRIVWLTNYLSWINQADPATIHRLPLPAEARAAIFTPTNSPRLALYNQIKKTLFLADPTVNTDGASVVIAVPNVEKAIWSSDGSRLLYTDGYGIYQRLFPATALDVPEERVTQLITRYAEPIKDIFWGDNESYLFYVIGQRLRVLEISSQYTPHSLTLLDAATDLRESQFVPTADWVTFIDGAGRLQALSLSREESRALFFGD